MKSFLLGALAIFLTVSLSTMPLELAAQACIPEEALPVPLPEGFRLPPGGVCPGPELEAPPFEEELDGPPLEEEFPPFGEELDGPPLEKELDEPTLGLIPDPLLPEELDEPAPLDPIIDPNTGVAIADGVGVKADQLPEGVSPDALGELDSAAIGDLGGDALGSFSSDQIADLDAAAVGGLSADQLGSLAPGALAGFDANQVAGLDASSVAGLDATKVAAMDDDAMAGFDAAQVAGFDAAAIGGFNRDKIAAMDPRAMAGFSAAQVERFDADALGGFNEDKVAAMDADAMVGFEADQLTMLTAAAFAGFDSEKMSNLDKKALSGISAEQFSELPPLALGGLKSENLGGLAPDVFRTMSEEELASLDPSEVREMKGEDFSKLVTNLNEFSVEQDTVAALLPEGWTMDETGDLKAPPGAGLSFASLEREIPLDGDTAPKVAAQPDLSTDLALGGGSGTNSVLSGMDSALESANVNGLGFTQTSDGILNVGGDDGPAAAAFITDAAKMVQAPEDALPGISIDQKTGGYVVTTEQGYQIPLKPAVANPTEIAALLPDSELEIGEGGQTSISNLIGED